ncbi:hypothetical protein HBB16_02520 [Pseudonocardia sp. MCCB 268]|nr:hypothetical protein [Pseudonocardia cytotoxica]
MIMAIVEAIKVAAEVVEEATNLSEKVRKFLQANDFLAERRNHDYEQH